MATKNDITGDEIKTKTVTDAYRNNYDRIFRKKETTYEEQILKNEYQDILSTEECLINDEEK